MKRLARWVLPALLLLAFALDLRRSGDIVRAQRLLRAVEGRTVAMLKSGNLQRPLLLAHVEALPARVPAAALRPSIGAPGNDWILVGYGVAGATAGDLIVQRVAAPCSPLFADGFESGGTTAWSSVVT